MTKLLGCLSLLVSALFGLCLGLYLAWPKPIRFIDQTEAKALAIANGRYECRKFYDEKQIDCVRLHVDKIQEQKEGWLIDVVSNDRRRYFSMWINRAGEYESMGNDDLDQGPREFGFSGGSAPYPDSSQVPTDEN